MNCMKKNITLVFIVCIATFVNAQSDADTISTSKKINATHQLGLNATIFIKQFLSFSNASVSVQSSPYVLDYSVTFNKKHGLKASLGGSYNNLSRQNSNTETEFQNRYSIDYRLGYFYHIKIAKKWGVQVGADVIASNANSLIRNNTTFDITTTSTKSFSIGGGGDLRMLFNINKRIALFTETGLYFTNTSSQEKIVSNNNPSFNRDIKSSSKKIEFIIPASIFFAIKF